MENEIEKYKKAIKEVRNSSDSFFGWFNNDGNKEASFISGEASFRNHIYRYYKQIGNELAVEIGYGGGRMIPTACKYFKKVIGIDIHNEIGLVSEALNNQGVSNFDLICGDGKTIPIKDEVADLVYSLIVFQHLKDIDILRSYVKESFRVLKKGGIAILYMGRMRKFGDDYNYESYEAEVNFTNLTIGKDFGIKLVEDTGFKIMNIIVSDRGGQLGFILRKYD